MIMVYSLIQKALTFVQIVLKFLSFPPPLSIPVKEVFFLDFLIWIELLSYALERMAFMSLQLLTF